MKYASDATWVIDFLGGQAQAVALHPTLVSDGLALSIVAYRDQFRADRRGDIPFKRAEDLLVVKGIGVAMLSTIRPHLMFPASGPSTPSGRTSAGRACGS